MGMQDIEEKMTSELIKREDESELWLQRVRCSGEAGKARRLLLAWSTDGRRVDDGCSEFYPRIWQNVRGSF